MGKALNKETAVEYVLKHLCELGYDDVRILRTTCWKKIGQGPHVDVYFDMRSDVDPSGRCAYNFEVWVEDGEIYGEW